MNRRQLTFVIVINALVSLAIVLLVTWIVEMRRPDPEVLAARYTPPAQAVLAPTATATVDVLPTVVGPADPAVATVQAAAATGEQVVYVVQSGDSLLGIASRYGTTIDAIVQANSLANPDFVFSGQRLIPIEHPILRSEATWEQTLAMVDRLAPARTVFMHIEEPESFTPDDYGQLAAQLRTKRGWDVTFAYDTLVIEL